MSAHKARELEPNLHRLSEYVPPEMTGRVTMSTLWRRALERARRDGSASVRIIQQQKGQSDGLL